MQAFIGATASLMFFCAFLQAHPIPQMMKEFQTALKDMKNWNCIEELYTPINVEKQCIIAALQCFDKELNILTHCIKGMEDRSNTIQDIHRFVSELSSNSTFNESLCQCENNESNFMIYIDEFMKLTQQLNTQ